MNDQQSKQFTHPLLAQAYDSINALGDDASFWLNETNKLAPKTIIDFGCGTGLLTCELAKLGYEVTGIDPAGQMLEIAKTKASSDKIRWIEGNYTKLEGLSADLILMTSHVAQFLLTDTEFLGTLRNCFNALNPNGHLLFDSRRSLKDSFKNWPTKDNPRHETDPKLGEIEYYCNLLETTDVLAKYELHYYFVKSSEHIVSTDQIIFRPKSVIEKSLQDVGFTIEHIYGDWDGSDYNEVSPEMLFLVRK